MDNSCESLDFYPQVEKLSLPEVVALRLDVDALPKRLRHFVVDGAERMQCPADFIVVTALCSIAGALGTSVVIQPKSNDVSYQITPTLWGALIGSPSSMKSPSISYGLKPLRSLEEDLAENFVGTQKEYRAQKKLFDISVKQAEGEAIKASKAGNTEKAFAELALAIELEPEEPSEPRIIINDSTVPKIGELMNSNPRGLLLVRDELSAWISDLQSESAGADRAFYLEAYNGNGRFTYDRISRGTVHIEKCCLSLVGGIQPSRLRPVIRDALSGKADDGLLQRLQLAVWPPNNLDRQYVDRVPDTSSSDQFASVLRAIAQFDQTTPRTIRFCDDAQLLFQQWWCRLQSSLKAINNSSFQAFKIKQEKTLCTIAAIFQLLVDTESNEISYQNYIAAETFIDYLSSHAEKIYMHASDDRIEVAMLLCSRRERLTVPFTARDVQRKGWAGMKTSEDVLTILNLLEEKGYLVSIVSGPPVTGGVGKKLYDWNPSLTEDDFTFEQSSH